MHLLLIPVLLLVFLGPVLSAAILKRLALALAVLILALAALVSTVPTLPAAQHDALSPAGKLAVVAAVVWAALRGVAWVLDAARG